MESSENFKTKVEKALSSILRDLIEMEILVPQKRQKIFIESKKISAQNSSLRVSNIYNFVRIPKTKKRFVKKARKRIKDTIHITF